MTGPSLPIDLQTRLEAFAATLARYRADLTLGRDVDLADLDRQVGNLCLDIFNARPESVRFGPRLQNLVGELDALGADLARRHRVVN